MVLVSIMTKTNTHHDVKPFRRIYFNVWVLYSDLQPLVCGFLLQLLDFSHYLPSCHCQAPVQRPEGLCLQCLPPTWLQRDPADSTALQRCLDVINFQGASAQLSVLPGCPPDLLCHSTPPLGCPVSATSQGQHLSSPVSPILQLLGGQARGGLNILIFFSGPPFILSLPCVCVFVCWVDYWVEPWSPAILLYWSFTCIK